MFQGRYRGFESFSMREGLVLDFFFELIGVEEKEAPAAEEERDVEALLAMGVKMCVVNVDASPTLTSNSSRRIILEIVFLYFYIFNN